MSEQEHFNPLKITGVTVTWEVENVWKLSFDGVSSASFLLSGHIFHLFVRRYELSIAVYLCRDDAIPSALSLLCRMCMVDHIGQEKTIGEKEMQVSKGKEVVLIDSINIESLESMKEEFLINDTLVIRCNLSATYRRSVLKTAEPTAGKTIKCYETLSSDLASLLDSPKNPDAFLKADGAEFHAHRNILQARAPVLASLLPPPASAGNDNDNPANVDDIESDTFRAVLLYVYTGKVRALTPENAVRMLEAAGRFSLLELRSVCLSFLLSNLTDENVFEAASLAFECDDATLKEEVKGYVVGRLPDILHSDRWKGFCAEKYKHANEILTHVLLHMQGKKES